MNISKNKQNIASFRNVKKRKKEKRKPHAHAHNHNHSVRKPLQLHARLWITKHFGSNDTHVPSIKRSRKPDSIAVLVDSSFKGRTLLLPHPRSVWERSFGSGKVPFVGFATEEQFATADIWKTKRNRFLKCLPFNQKCCVWVLQSPLNQAAQVEPSSSHSFTTQEHLVWSLKDILPESCN